MKNYNYQYRKSNILNFLKRIENNMGNLKNPVVLKSNEGVLHAYFQTSGKNSYNIFLESTEMNLPACELVIYSLENFENFLAIMEEEIEINFTNNSDDGLVEYMNIYDKSGVEINYHINYLDMADGLKPKDIIFPVKIILDNKTIELLLTEASFEHTYNRLALITEEDKKDKIISIKFGCSHYYERGELVFDTYSKTKSIPLPKCTVADSFNLQKTFSTTAFRKILQLNKNQEEAYMELTEGCIKLCFKEAKWNSTYFLIALVPIF